MSTINFTLPVDGDQQMTTLADWFHVHPVVIAFLLALALDIITGLYKAYIRKELDSKTSFSGMMKKIGTLFLIAVAYIIDPFDGGLPLLDGSATALLVYEVVSILENLSAAGIWVPGILKKALKVMQEEEESKEGGDSGSTT